MLRNFNSNQDEIYQFFKKALEDRSSFFVWQKSQEEKAKNSRLVLKEVNRSSLYLVFTSLSKMKNTDLIELQIAYFHHPDTHTSFRSSLLQANFPIYRAGFPYSLNVDHNEEKEVKEGGEEFYHDDYWAEEEEKIYAHLREAPRGKFNDDSAKINVIKRGSKTALLYSFQLFDLSKGGLSFITDDENLFQLKEVLQIVSIKNRPMGQIPCIVRSIRPIERDQFKIGIQFLPTSSY